MTALAAAAFLALLDDLPSVTRPKTNTDVLLRHAAATIRDLLAQVQAMERDDDAEVADEELDELLRRAAAHANLQCPEHGLMCKGAGCCCADRHQDVPRPGNLDENPGTRSVPGPGHQDLSHLPPMAGPGENMCQAVSPAGANGLWWECNARRGHIERFHASHYRLGDRHGTPAAADFPDAMWPVAAKETGMPLWADGLPAHLGPLTVCGAVNGRWTCNAVPGHAPLDHVAFAPWGHRMAGSPLARWASVHPGAGLADLPLTAEPYPDHDVNMPHDVRYGGWRSCPPYCPYRLWCERHDLADPLADGHETSEDVPRPVDDGPSPRETEPADGTQPVTAVGPGHHNAGPDGFIEIADDPDDITKAEHLEAIAYVLKKYGEIPPSLQHVIDMGGRFKHVPRPGGSMEGPEVRETDVPVHAVTPSAGPGHHNGHALRPPDLGDDPDGDSEPFRFSVAGEEGEIG